MIGTLVLSPSVKYPFDPDNPKPVVWDTHVWQFDHMIDAVNGMWAMFKWYNGAFNTYEHKLFKFNETEQWTPFET